MIYHFKTKNIKLMPKLSKIVNWKSVATDLYKALDRFAADCNHLAHRSGEYHSAGEACPVCQKIEAAKLKYEEAIKK